MKKSLLASATACVASALLASSANAYNTYTITFQQGVNGYTGELDRTFATNNSTAGGIAPNGSGLNSVDGWDADTNGTGSPDRQVFLKFNNIVGSAPGQIPNNAFVLDASLSLTTGPGGSDNSGGPIGVGAVLVPWNTTTSTYANLKPAGSPANALDAAHGVITPAVGFYDDPAVLYNGTNKLDFGQRYSASVAPLVQGWANGTIPNYGFTVHAGTPSATEDAWAFGAATHATIANRPQLSVTYTDAPIQTASFQDGVNGYNGTTMSWLRMSDNSGTNGLSLDHAFLDGYQDSYEADTISSDDHALIKFTNLFAADGGSIPEHAQIVKATLVLTTSTVGNAQTGQPFEAHQMLRDWGTSTAWTDFDEYVGIRIGIDEGQRLSAQYGMIPQSQAQFDITQAVESWQAGDPNYGIDIRATPGDPPLDNTNAAGTSDGWSIYFNGATDPTLRPQLLISYFLHMPGDANDNGKIDADDFALTDRGFAKHFASPTWANGDFDYNGVVDAADYHILDLAYAQQGGTFSSEFLASREAQFGAAYVSSLLAAVPEPTSLSLLALGAAATLTRRRRRSH